VLVTGVPAFRRFWYPVAFAEDLAAGPLARRVLGEDLVVWSTADGGAAAARDKCPHRSSKLSVGWVDGGCPVCPYHGWQFDADGRASHIPQLEAGLPAPPKAQLRSVHATVRYGVVWVALEDPVGGLPEVPEHHDPAYRAIRQFDEVWAAAAPRLVDNSFDPAHVAYVHRKTFGSPADARIEPPSVERTDDGMVMVTSLVVRNDLELAQRANGVGEERTTRDTVSRFVAPFLRVMSITYPTGLNHVLVTGICPVDDTHLRLVQWAVRNDTEADVPGADVVAFDRVITLEDQWLLEQTDPDYELDLNDLAHVKVDRGTIAVRRIYGEIVDGTWPALAAAAPLPAAAVTTVRG
jgi:phenylpropionate dioxygenase-like ring-hydroxylating dioxygenase large terminal subunit